MHPAAWLTVATAFLMTPQNAFAAEEFIIVQSTTSTQASGLYDYLLPKFEEVTDIDIRVVAVGTGQAIKNAQNCDGDVLLVHSAPDEEKFVAEGYGTARHDLMYNDFVIVGPNGDPAGIGETGKVADALAAIEKAGAPFASRADDSGTHKKEMTLWKAAGIDPTAASGSWYRETGSGMGATLNTAIGMNAYAMTDRATWIAFANKADHDILVEGDPELFNQYGVIVVSATACPRTKTEAAQRFTDWLLSAHGQEAIAGFQLEGRQLFFPNGGRE